MFLRSNAVLLSLWLAVPALAEDLPPEELARIKHEQKEAVDKVQASHGRKKSSEMDNAERQQMTQEQQAALQGVLDKHGVSRKDYARQTAQQGPAGNAAVSAAEKAQEAEREAAAKKASEAASKEAEPVVEVGPRADADAPEPVEITVDPNASAAEGTKAPESPEAH